MNRKFGFLSVVMGLLLAFAGVSSALANDLHQATPIVGTSFGEPDCSDNLGTGWIFVNTGSHDATGAVLTATFKDAGTVQVNGFTPGNGIVHYYVSVSPSDTLLSASDSLNTDGKLNLSHVCYTVQSPSPSPSESPSSSPSSSPSASPSTSPSASPSTSPSSTPSSSPSSSPSASPSTSPSASSTPSGTLVPPATGTPNSTVPPTDVAQVASKGDNGSSILLVIASLVLTAGALLLTPRRQRKPNK